MWSRAVASSVAVQGSMPAESRVPQAAASSAAEAPRRPSLSDLDASITARMAALPPPPPAEPDEEDWGTESF